MYKAEILGVGHDLIEISRIKQVHLEHGDRFLERIFTPDEIAYCLSFENPYPSFAARFAAKEAGSKAIGVGIGRLLGWHDLEVLRDPAGKPSLQMSKTLLQRYPNTQILLSLSHTKELASAFAIWTSISSK